MTKVLRVFDCDLHKRNKILLERHFDLRDVAHVFADPQRIEFIDRRFDYGEERRVTIGTALGRVFTVVYTMRGLDDLAGDSLACQSKGT